MMGTPDSHVELEDTGARKQLISIAFAAYIHPYRMSTNKDRDELKIPAACRLGVMLNIVKLVAQRKFCKPPPIRKTLTAVRRIAGPPTNENKNH